MLQDPRLADLLLDWEEALREGRPVSVDELCRDCPELIEELRRQIHALETITPVLDLTAYQERPTEVETNRPSESTPNPAKPASAGPDEPAPSFALPGFELLTALGRGGMGVVYKALQTGLDRLVAIKMVLTGLHASPAERTRFQTEARLIARLNHPHIVQIYAIGEHEKMPYFVMEYMEGGSLAEELRRPFRKGPGLPPLQAAAVLEPLARAMHHAHRQGVIHRDLKPANVLLRAVRLSSDGEIELDTPKLCDFGLARHLDQERLTRPGSVVGTPSYMAPEQAMAHGVVGPLTDVYGLGVLLYEMLTDAVPFDQGADWQILQAVVNKNPEPPSKFRSDPIEALEAICLRCLRKSPADRYPSAEALANDLGRFLKGQPVQANDPALRPLSRRRWLIGAAVAAPTAAAIWIGASTGWFGSGSAGPPVKVGLLHPVSGTMALSGAAAMESEQLAIQEINRQGGLLGRPVEAVIGDSDSTPEGMAREAERLIEKEGVAVLVGGWTSPDRKAIKSVVERYDRLLFYPVECEGLEQSPNIVYLGSLPNQLVLPTVRFFVEQGKRRFFLVGLDAIYANAVQAILKDYLPSLKGELCAGDLIPLSGADLKALADRIHASKPDAILNLIQGDYNTAVFRRLREAGVRPPDVPTISFSLTEKELPGVNRKDMVGDYLAGSYFQSIDTPANHQYLKQLQAFRNMPPVTSDSMEAGYVAVRLWARAVRTAGSTETAAVRNALAGMTFDGPGGRTTVEAGSLCSDKYARIGQIQPDGRISVVWETPLPLRPEPFPDTRTREAWERFLQEHFRRWDGHWFNPGAK